MKKWIVELLPYLLKKIQFMLGGGFLMMILKILPSMFTEKILALVTSKRSMQIPSQNQQIILTLHASPEELISIQSKK